MPSLKDFLLGQNLKSKLDEKAHFSEGQWVNASLEWAEGTKTLKGLFPRDTRTEKPRSWYDLIRDTHWPGRVIPGNGPFFVPDSVLGKADDEEAAKLRDGLKSAGFKLRQVPVAIVPPTSEYIHEAMRVAGNWAWNVDPVLYQAYWYPGMRGKADNLRPYNTKRWQLDGGDGDG